MLFLKRRVLVVALTMAAASACAQSPGQADSMWSTVRDSAGIEIVENGPDQPTAWRLSSEPIFEIGAGLGVEAAVLDPTSVFAGPDGTIAVGDGNQVGWDAILVYSEAGALLQKLGGPGRGPGEFGGQLWWAAQYRGDSLIAWDRRGPSGPSIKVFDPTGHYVRDVTIPMPERLRPEGTRGYSPGVHGWFSDGRFLTSSQGVIAAPSREGPVTFQHLLLSVDPLGATWDTIGEFGLTQAYWDGREQVGYRFGVPGLVRAYGDGVLLATSADYEYRILDRSGVTQRIVRKATPFTPVQPEDVEALVENFLDFMAQRAGITDQDLARFRVILEATPTAEQKPAYSSILVDSELNVWVERYRSADPWGVPPNPRSTTWDVFDPDGFWIATLEVPAAVLLLSVSAGRAYGVRIDELDVRHVVVYEIIRS